MLQLVISIKVYPELSLIKYVFVILSTRNLTSENDDDGDFRDNDDDV